ncbi:hypothetical protein H9P43_003138 [Blastocladiella emersonii ATCC 22665]|nr:hypothetical protein H9P43_003109 [Blastocladiella emersonii ATCC 22665]KAI9184085.1 hypothetical protein H9P43_003138 [Blastocladiella emersonii ATCC 22665]
MAKHKKSAAQTAASKVGVRYLGDYEYDGAVTADQRKRVAPSSSSWRTAGSTATSAKSPSISPDVSIRFIDDPNHPAFPHRGLFAAKKLAPGQHILNYIGIVYPNSSFSPTSDYILTLDSELCIDADKAGNEARFINDYRGIPERAAPSSPAAKAKSNSLGPNAEFRDYRDTAGTLRMGVFVRKSGSGIKKGEEICVSYGKGFWQTRGLLGNGDSSGDAGETATEDNAVIE